MNVYNMKKWTAFPVENIEILPGAEKQIYPMEKF